MEIQYQTFDGDQNKKTNRTLIALLVATCLALIAVVIVLIVYVVNNSSSSSNVEYCSSPECLELAAEISNSINSSVDPCDDFYHYVCDGWIADNSWINIDYAQYNNFDVVMNNEKETFLDAIYYNTKPSIVNHSSVHKATTYMSTCYDSTVDMEDTDTAKYLAKLLDNIYFADMGQNWGDDNTIRGFQSALKYLNQIGFLTLFSLTPVQEKTVWFMQMQELWDPLTFQQINYTSIFTRTFVPLYQAIFNLSYTDATDAANDVIEFIYSVENITTIGPDYYDANTYYAMLRAKNFTDLASIFKDGTVMNYTQLVYDVYSASAMDLSTGFILYFTDGVEFFNNLTTLIENTPPYTVQLYLYTSILFYYLNFEETMVEQSRYQDRTDFCFTRTQNQFAFVYGNILFNELYDTAQYETAQTLASKILEDGTKTLINNATWLDTSSQTAALKKVQYMQLFIGFPSRIKNGSAVDKYYSNAKQNSSNTWVKNVELLNMFNFEMSYDTFWGSSYEITQGWPATFSSSASFPMWLTGVNAFYAPTGNWFTIPITISQPPFLSSYYPSSVNFGGLGSVCGHEMSHGFDPSGSQYDYQGNYVGSIFTDETRNKYDDKLTCFKNQYSNVVIDKTKNGKLIYDNGTQTITENVADNAGVWSSWTAWKSYIKENGNDKLLYGVEATQEQLFFLGWGRLWCESTIPGSYLNWTDVHSPNYARVIVPLQNNHHFADAFNCPSGSNMNPKDKCLVW